VADYESAIQMDPAAESKLRESLKLAREKLAALKRP
jgi:hypothetical protein